MKDASMEELRRRERVIALAIWGGFVRCPNTDRVIEVLAGDDKAICGCRQSNPRVPEERTERTGVHIVRYCTVATVEEYLDQRDSDREKEENT